MLRHLEHFWNRHCPLKLRQCHCNDLPQLPTTFWELFSGAIFWWGKERGWPMVSISLQQATRACLCLQFVVWFCIRDEWSIPTLGTTHEEEISDLKSWLASHKDICIYSHRSHSGCVWKGLADHQWTQRLWSFLCCKLSNWVVDSLEPRIAR